MTSAIKVSNLTKVYNRNKAVDDVSLTVSKGEVFGLLGANGAGKSTTIECIVGTKAKDRGTVSVLGLDPVKQRKELYERVSVQFQEASYQEKIRVDELCEMTQSLYKQTGNYKELLEQFGLTDKIRSQVSDLSGGQKQKLFIVIALIPQPEVVFLDELTTGLDARARRDVWTILTKMKENGLTIFLSSHFMDEIEVLCDTICILRNGRVIFYGTVREAIDNSPNDTLEDAYLWYTDEEEKK